MSTGTAFDRVRSALLLLFALFYVAPIYFVVVLAFKPEAEVASDPFALPRSLYLGNFDVALSASSIGGSASIGPAFVNSLTITVVSVVLIVMSGAMAGFVLARRNDRLAEWLFVTFVLGLTIPVQLGVVPLFQMLRSLNLVGTLWGMILIYTAVAMPFTIFLYTTFIRALPRDFEEAALMDGASWFRVFWDVVFPLVLPVTGTVVVIQGAHIWNDLFMPIIFLLGSGADTLPAAIYSLMGEWSTAWGPIFAAVTLVSAPMMVLFVLLQKHIIKGFSGGIR